MLFESLATIGCAKFEWWLGSKACRLIPISDETDHANNIRGQGCGDITSDHVSKSYCVLPDNQEILATIKNNGKTYSVFDPLWGIFKSPYTLYSGEGNRCSRNSVDQSVIRRGIKVLCDFLRSSAFMSLQDALETGDTTFLNSEEFMNAEERLMVFLGADNVNLTAIRLAEDPLSHAIGLLRTSSEFVNETVPDVLESLNDFSDVFNFTASDIDLVQSLLRRSGNLTTTETRNELMVLIRDLINDETSRGSILSLGVVASLLGLDNSAETRGALDDLIDAVADAVIASNPREGEIRFQVPSSVVSLSEDGLDSLVTLLISSTGNFTDESDGRIAYFLSILESEIVDFNVTALLNADNPRDEVFRQVLGTQEFIDDVVPNLLGGFNNTFPSRFNFTENEIVLIQELLRQELSNGTQSSEIRSDLEALLEKQGLQPIEATAVVAAILGLSSSEETINVLNDFAYINQSRLSELSDVAVDLLSALDTRFALEGLLNFKVNVSSAREAEDPLTDIWYQILESSLLVNDSIPELLSTLNREAPDTFNFSDTDIAGIQQLIKDTARSNSTVTQDTLLTFLENRTSDAAAALSNLFGLGSSDEAQAALDDVLDGGSFNTSRVEILVSEATNVPRSDISDLVDELDRLRVDLFDITKLENAFRQITDLPEFANFANDLAGTGTSTAFEQFICPEESGGQGLISIGFRRRDDLTRPEIHWSRKRRAQAGKPDEDKDALESQREVTQILSSLSNSLRIYYSPDTPEIRNIIKRANATFDSIATLETIFDCAISVATTCGSVSGGSNLCNRKNLLLGRMPLVSKSYTTSDFSTGAAAITDGSRSCNMYWHSALSTSDDDLMFAAVTLAVPAVIERVVLATRCFKCSNRINNVEIWLVDASGIRTMCGSPIVYSQQNNALYEIKCTSNATRASMDPIVEVRVELKGSQAGGCEAGALQIAELEAYGTEVVSSSEDKATRLAIPLDSGIASRSVSGTGLFNLDVWRGFPDEESMVADGMYKSITELMGAIHFYNVLPDGTLPSAPGDGLRYSIRQHIDKTPKTNKLRRWYSRPGPGGNQNFQYYYGGFLWLQDMIDRGFTSYRADGNVKQPASFINQFPTPKYRRDNFAFTIGQMMPLIMVLSWIYSVSMIAKSVVYEKETRLKEYMKIMGLKTSMHWLGWFITKFILLTTTVILLTIILFQGGIFTYDFHVFSHYLPEGRYCPSPCIHVSLHNYTNTCSLLRHTFLLSFFIFLFNQVFRPSCCLLAHRAFWLCHHYYGVPYLNIFLKSPDGIFMRWVNLLCLLLPIRTCLLLQRNDDNRTKVCCSTAVNYCIWNVYSDTFRMGGIRRWCAVV